MDNIFCNVKKLDKKDKDYHQIMCKREKLLDKFWERVYIDGDMSWQEIFDYMNSGDFTKDVVRDLFNIAQSDMMEDSLK